MRDYNVRIIKNELIFIKEYFRRLREYYLNKTKPFVREWIKEVLLEREMY